jgi:hypothetical protein
LVGVPTDGRGDPPTQKPCFSGGEGRGDCIGLLAQTALGGHSKTPHIMEKYQNKDGDSGVSAYENGYDYIIVEFEDGSRYLYNWESAGGNNIDRMKRMALDGKGLNRFIAMEMKNRYAVKLK